jgi:hypothetical protein
LVFKSKNITNAFFYFWWDWGLNVGFCAFAKYTLPLDTSPTHLALVILEMKSQELFVQAGLEP